MSSFEPIPLAIGFTGHRDISPDDESKLREALRKRLTSLKSANKSTPLRAFTGLAEGADMAFVEAASDLGIEIILVLPVPQDEFVRDFEHPAHPDRDPETLKQSYERLFQKAAHVHTIPVPEGQPAESIKSQGAARDAQYSAAGAFIVRQSSILIAVWNGVTTDKPGGTGDVVRFKRDGVPPQAGETEDFPAPPDGGPVMQVGTTRVDSVGDAEPSWHADSYPELEKTYRREFNKALKRLRTFNRDAVGFTRDHPDRVAESRARLLPPDAELDEFEARAVETYAVADALAIVQRGRAHRAFGTIAVLAVLMVIAFEFYGHNVVATPVWIFVYLGVFSIACCFYGWERWSKFHARYLDYRCLAEGLRVQIFWHLAGLTEVAADNYLHQVRSELRWIRDALRSTMVRMPAAASRLKLVRERWVWSQSEFFTEAASREQTGEQTASWFGTGFFILGLVIAVSLAGLEARAFLEKSSLSHEVPGVIAAVLTIAFVSAMAGAIKGYAIKRAYAEHAKQYARMARVFSLARKRLDSANDETLTARTRSVLLALGREALAENVDWILLHRERQTEPPI